MSIPLDIRYDSETDIATINGVQFSGELLRTFAGEGIPEDRWFRVKRDGDIVSVYVMYDTDGRWHAFLKRIGLRP